MTKNHSRIIYALSFALLAPAQAFATEGAYDYGNGNYTAPAPAAPVPSPTPKNKLEFIPITYLDTLQINDLVNNIQATLGLPAGTLRTFYSQILVDADKKTLKMVKDLIATRDVKPKHIIFEGTFITVRPFWSKQVGHKIESSHNRVTGNRTFTNTGLFDLGINQAFADTIVATFNQKGNELKITAGYLLEQGLAKVVSKPIVRVKDGDSALFKSVTALPQVTAGQYGTNVQYKETGISLAITQARVIPSAGPGEDPMIYAEIDLSDGSINRAASVGNTLATDDTKVTSKGFYQNGQAFIAASLIKELEGYSFKQVPLLHKIPVIGNLFKNKEQTKESSETLVLLRPTIEETMSQQFLAARFHNSRNVMPRDLGGRSNDSIQSHPLSDGPWQGVPRIYDDSRCKEKNYWRLLDVYTEDEIQALGKYFSSIRNRTGLLLSQSEDQIRKIIFNDKGLDAAVQTALNEFAQKTKKQKPSVLDFLIAAAHSGKINEWAFDVYLERLKVKEGCWY